MPFSCSHRGEDVLFIHCLALLAVLIFQSFACSFDKKGRPSVTTVTSRFKQAKDNSNSAGQKVGILRCSRIEGKNDDDKTE